MSKTYIHVDDEVIERVKFGVEMKDPDAILAKQWADEFYLEKGNYSGIDGHLSSKFVKNRNPDAVRKFVNLK
ncbi:hypothetical protein [Paenibacillus rubinfantis]|uniref:hypothetical protein n=1 Tax=Paenibacillus rubinfantis TaxID=1720296 RepID=UPI00073E6628|nr:hypothetical protein [Paenibacillus rubinfantis]